jgi:hypothetical protein
MPNFQPYEQAAKERTWQRETTENKNSGTVCTPCTWELTNRPKKEKGTGAAPNLTRELVLSEHPSWGGNQDFERASAIREIGSDKDRVQRWKLKSRWNLTSDPQTDTHKEKWTVREAKRRFSNGEIRQQQKPNISDPGRRTPDEERRLELASTPRGNQD